MTSDEALAERLGRLGPVFHAKEAVEAGVSWRDLYHARDSGLVVELSRGLYQLREANGIDRLDFVTVCARAPQGMICLGSALSYWDLSDDIPAWVDLAVPSGTHRPQIDHPPTQVHVFRAASFEFGKIDIKVKPGIGFAITRQGTYRRRFFSCSASPRRGSRRWRAPSLSPPARCETRASPRTGRRSAS